MKYAGVPERVSRPVSTVRREPERRGVPLQRGRVGRTVGGAAEVEVRLSRWRRYGGSEEAGVEAAEAEAAHPLQGGGAGADSMPAVRDPKLPHRVCPSCGTYKDNQVVEVEQI